jgi:hypothetical protein
MPGTGAVSPGAIEFLVTTPSMSTFETPLTVATITTRKNRRGTPPASRNKMWSGDVLSMLNVILKALVPTSCVVTSTESSASMTSRGGVTGTTGPIIRLSSTRLSTGPSGNG